MSRWAAAFGRLCVETLSISLKFRARQQPPSGGCVLKHFTMNLKRTDDPAAAFGRLCVETSD